MEMDSISTTTTMHCTSTSSAFHRPARADIFGHISEPVRSQSLHNPPMNVMESERPLFSVQGNCTTMTQQMHGSLGAMSSSNPAEIAFGDEVECGDGLMVVEEEEEEEEPPLALNANTGTKEDAKRQKLVESLEREDEEKDQEKGEKEAEEQANMDADEAAAEEASNADDEPAHFQQPLCEKTLQEEEMVLEVKPAGKTAKWYKNGQELEPQTVKWFHNGQELKAADQLEMQVEQQNGGIFRLAIKSALKEDIGTYKILLHNTEAVGSAQLGVSLPPMGPVDSNMSYQGEQNQVAADGPGLAEEVHADATEGGAGGGLPIVWEPGRNLGSRIATCTHDGHKFRFTRKEGNFYRCEGCRTLRNERGYGRVKTIKIDRETFVTDPTAGHICH